MKRSCLKEYVFRSLYPWPRANEPKNWTDFVTACLVPEVRQETMRFYGPTDEEEAKWPGLDYTARGHRLRLSSFPHHRHLFRAFDRLKLTDSEIYNLCTWEGTKYAKDKFNASAPRKVRDTTFDGVREDNRQRGMPEGRPHLVSIRSIGVSGGRHSDRRSLSSSISSIGKAEPSPKYAAYEIIIAAGADDECLSDREDGRTVVERSVGNALNRRLREATAARLQGQNVPLDPAYEQWLKDARERGTISNISNLPSAAAMGLTPPINSPSLSSRHGHSHGQRYSPTQARPQSRRGGSGSSPNSTYWTQTVPEIFRYGSQTIYQTPALAHIAESQRLVQAPPLYPHSPRYQLAPLSGAGDARRTRRASESRR